MSAAVCYIGSTGYLFPAAVSAMQAREHTPPEVDVVVVGVGPGGRVPEEDALRRLGDAHGIGYVPAALEELGGLHPMYARLFLDRFLPPGIDRVLYLDGDTQVLGDLAPLVALPLADGELAGARDPMVLLRRLDRRFRDRIDGWWDSSGIPAELRPDYLNSGVLRFDRGALPALRGAALGTARTGDGRLVFTDQDAINLAAAGRTRPVSMRWNFPGFLLGSALATAVVPRIVHFMSDPRPWDGPFWPWGSVFHEPYRRAARAYPDLARHQPRMSRGRRARYRAQQAYKRLRERPLWQSPAALNALRELEAPERVAA